VRRRTREAARGVRLALVRLRALDENLPGSVVRTLRTGGGEEAAQGDPTSVERESVSPLACGRVLWLLRGADVDQSVRPLSQASPVVFGWGEEERMNGPRLFVGIDPGVSGGLAAVDSRGRAVAWTGMPETEADIWQWLVDIGATSLDETGNTQIAAALEKVSSSPQQGVVSAFTFGKGYGVLRMALIASEIPFDEVRPQVWQKSLNCLTKGDKNVSKKRATELFPGVKCTHAISDALLIAEWCRRSRVGQLAEAV
jgi:Holliday junction resolvasome RuvABC endonuclease subunit